MTITNLADFGYRELEMAAKLLTAYKSKNDLTRYFDDDGVTIMMNQNSGNVFLTNSNFDVAMMNGDDLEDWFYTPCSGYEGFAEDLKEQYESDPNSWDEEDIQFLVDLNIIEATEEEGY